MDALLFAIAVAVLAFGAGVLGLKLRDWLPPKHAPDEARGMIGAMTGMLSLLLALVLGTLVGSAYSIYTTQKTELETLAARAVQLDVALEAYGPETEPGRAALRKAIRQSYDKIWGDQPTGPAGVDVKSVMAGTKLVDNFLLSLTPKTDAQKQMLASATAASTQIAQTRVMMILQLAAGINWPLLSIVVAWSLLLFCGYGLVSPMNATVLTALALGAMAVASALLLIIELSRPYAGVFKIPAGSVEQALDALGA